jgi:hypothetical protein
VLWSACARPFLLRTQGPGVGPASSPILRKPGRKMLTLFPAGPERAVIFAGLWSAREHTLPRVARVALVPFAAAFGTGLSLFVLRPCAP